MKKQLMIEAGLALVREGGMSAVSARAVGRKIGRTHAAILYHFGTSAALYDAVAALAVQKGERRAIRELIAADHPSVARVSPADKSRWMGL